MSFLQQFYVNLLLSIKSRENHLIFLGLFLIQHFFSHYGAETSEIKIYKPFISAAVTIADTLLAGFLFRSLIQKEQLKLNNIFLKDQDILLVKYNLIFSGTYWLLAFFAANSGMNLDKYKFLLENATYHSFAIPFFLGLLAHMYQFNFSVEELIFETKKLIEIFCDFVPALTIFVSVGFIISMIFIILHFIFGIDDSIVNILSLPFMGLFFMFMIISLGGSFYSMIIYSKNEPCSLSNYVHESFVLTKGNLLKIFILTSIFMFILIIFKLVIDKLFEDYFSNNLLFSFIPDIAALLTSYFSIIILAVVNYTLFDIMNKSGSK